MSAAARVVVPPAWRLGKKMLGLQLPMRPGAGEPSHAGAGRPTTGLGPTGMVEAPAD
jgi:hypothetical protein